MSQVFNFLFFISILILASAEITNVEDLHIDIRNQIMNKYLESGNMKQLFKAYHFAYGKSYDYNTIQGLDKYKTFKANIKELIEHNKSDATWKMGINHLTDMTFEEVSKYYNLKYFTPKEVSRQLRSVSLDDFEDEDAIPEKTMGNVQYTAVDWRPYLQPVKNQGMCGSCWAFGTIAMIEGSYAAYKRVKLPYALSTQQLVDCDTGDSGCNGGWFTNAILYLVANLPMKDIDYPYKALQGTCKYDKTKGVSDIRPLSYKYSSSPDTNFASLKIGPFAAAIDANDSFRKYTSGVWNAACGTAVNHAVFVVGYSATLTAWIVQNSWASTWGEKGFIMVADQGANNKYSCYIGRYGYRANY